MKMIPLNKGKFATVDDEDFDRLSQFKWIACQRTGQQRWYAMRSSGKGMTSTGRKMDRHIITIVPVGFLIDHINGDSLDNRRANLRIATNQQNSMNARKVKIGRSRYKGVSRFYDVWLAKVRMGGKTFIAGTFPCQFCAALAYDQKARELFGEFARPNFPEV